MYLVATVKPQREMNYINLPNGAVITIKRDGEVEPLVQESYVKGLNESSKKEFISSIKDPRIQDFLHHGDPSALGNSWKITRKRVGKVEYSTTTIKSSLPNHKEQELDIAYWLNGDRAIYLFTEDKNFTQSIGAELNPNDTINEQSICENLEVWNPNVVTPNLK